MKKRLAALALSFFALGASGPVDVVLSPSQPTVGDVVTVRFPSEVQRVLVAERPEFEILRSEGNRIVLRSFRPGPLSIEGSLVRVNGATSRVKLDLRINSVLKPGDSLDPAALKPPRPLPPNMPARIALATAAAVALLSWIAALMLARRREAGLSARLLSPLEEFRAALARASRVRDASARLIQLADASRIYLARTDDNYRRELTTFELGHRLPRGEASSTILELLAAADLAKFSPWGPENRDYGYLIERLRRVPEQFEPKAEEAAA